MKTKDRRKSKNIQSHLSHRIQRADPFYLSGLNRPQQPVRLEGSTKPEDLNKYKPVYAVRRKKQDRLKAK